MAAKPDSIVLLAGGISFAGNFAGQKGFPDNGYAIIGATVALAFIASLTNGTPIHPAVRALAGLMLLASVYRYIPGFTKQKKEGKKNG